MLITMYKRIPCPLEHHFQKQREGISPWVHKIVLLSLKLKLKTLKVRCYTFSRGTFRFNSGNKYCQHLHVHLQFDICIVNNCKTTHARLKYLWYLSNEITCITSVHVNSCKTTHSLMRVCDEITIQKKKTCRQRVLYRTFPFGGPKMQMIIRTRGSNFC